MKNYDRILDRLTQVASREAPPAVELSGVLPLRVLAALRERRDRETGYLFVLEHWLLATMPAAIVVAGALWWTRVPAPPPREPGFAEASLVNALFEEALQP